MSHSLSVIIPVYNGSKWLPDCIQSVLNQTHTSFECILVNDASTDDSAKLIHEICSKDPRFHSIDHPVNKGAAQAKKTGILAAKGQYVLCIDQDDWIEKTMLAKLYRKAREDDHDFVYCDYQEESYGQSVFFQQEPVQEDRTITMKQIMAWEGYFPALWNKLIKRQLFESILFPAATYSEDRAVMPQVIYFVQSPAGIRESLYHWRDIQGSASRAKKRDLQNLIDDYDSYLTLLQFLAAKYPAEIKKFEPDLLHHLEKISKLFPGNERIIREYRISVSRTIDQIKDRKEMEADHIQNEKARTIARFRQLDSTNFSKRARRLGHLIYSRITPRFIRKMIRKIRAGR